jgi:hypothetical protein
VVKHVDAVELRVVVAAVLAVAADAVLVAGHLLKVGAHLVTGLARLRVRNLARRSRLEAGSKRGKKGGEELRNVIRNSVWKYGTVIGKLRSRARVYPEREYKWPYYSNFRSCGHCTKHAGCGRVRSRNICFGHVLVAVRQSRQRRDAVSTGEGRHGRFAAGQSKYTRLYGYSGKLALAAMNLRRV